MSSTPTKASVNPSSEWRRISEKINILKSSSKTNDSPEEAFSNAYEYQPEIEAILDFRLVSGLEQYMVAWKCNGNDLKTSWESEIVLDSINKDALVKFWVKTMLSAVSLPENDSVRSIFMRKLRNWTSIPSVTTTQSGTPKSSKKEPGSPHSPKSQPKKRPRYDTDTDAEKKVFKMLTFPSVSESYDENMLKRVRPVFPDRLHGIMEPEEFAELAENPNYEIGELIPINCENGQNSSFLTIWFHVSYETPETLGMSEDICKLYSRCARSEEIIHIGRKKYEKVSSMRKVSLARLYKKDEAKEEVPCTNEKERCGSSLSNASTHPPASPSSSSYSESGQSDSDATTEPRSSPTSDPELMEYEEGQEESTETTEKTLVNSEAQTNYLDPLACIYCQTKKGEAERLSSLRQIKTAKKNEQEIATTNGKQQSGKKGNSKDENEEEDLVEIEYEIEKILDYRRQDGTNMDEYYIRWKNYTPDYDTWEPDDNMSCCDKALITFYVNRAIERRNADQDLQRQLGNGTVATTDGRGITVSYAGKKKIKLPSLPPIPEVILEVLNGVIPISDGEVEMAFKLTKTVKKKSIWPKKKLLKIMQDLTGVSGSTPVDKALAQNELPTLRHQVLMIEAERRKDLVLKDLKNWEKHLNMIAKGKPEIVVENNYDLAGPPEDFRFINDNVLGEGVNFPDDPLEGCDCEDSCGKEKTQCCPGKHEKVLAYNNFKRLRVLPGYPIYECNKRCKCGPECTNRVVQDGTVNLAGTKLCIFRTNNDRGWGVKTLKKIKRGAFVCLYAGEIITSEEAEKRGQVYEKELGACYLFDLDYYAGDSCPYTIDATKTGNVAHFINHSCEPNLCVFNVWADCVDQNLPKLAFFALRDISRDEELTYDYGTHDQDPVVPALPSFPPRDDPPPEPRNPIIKEMDEETEAGSDFVTDSQVLFTTASPAKNRMKPATVAMSAVRRPCLCGAKMCRKVLF